MASDWDVSIHIICDIPMVFLLLMTTQSPHKQQTNGPSVTEGPFCCVKEKQHHLQAVVHVQGCADFLFWHNLPHVRVRRETTSVMPLLPPPGMHGEEQQRRRFQARLEPEHSFVLCHFQPKSSPQGTLE